MAKKQIITEIKIKSSPEKVWKVLTDFPNYPTWNPFIKSIEGKVAVGNNIKASIDGMNFKPEVLVYKENKEFRWIGSLLFKGLFDGEHYFQIKDYKDGTVTFIQGENFSGILVGMFAKKLDNETKAGFIAMNEQLKIEAEKL